MNIRTFLPVSLIFAGVALVGSCAPGDRIGYLELPPSASLAPGYEGRVMVQGVPLQGIHGITVDNKGRLLVGSVVGSSIYSIGEPSNGKAHWRTVFGPPEGMADDMEQGPDGTLVWTAFLEGKVYALPPNAQEPMVIAENLPGVNSLAFDRDGRLFVTRVFLADELYEMDPKGVRPPRLIMDDLGGLNGFDFGNDNRLYGPLWFRNRIIALNVDSGDMRTVVDGLGIPAAVNFDEAGERLWAVDTQRGHLLSMDWHEEDGKFDKPVVRLEMNPALDNLVVDSDGLVYVTNMSDNSVTEYDITTDTSRTLVQSPLAVVADVAAASWQGRDVLYVADVFALRRIEVATGRVSTLGRVFGSHLDYPMHLDVDADHDTLVLSGWSAGKVQLFDLGNQRVIADLDSLTPHAPVFLPDGKIAWVEYATGQLMIADGRLRKARVAVQGLTTPSALLSVGGDKLYVAESAPGRIVEVDIGSGQRTEIYSGLIRPEGLAMAPDGSLLVVDSGADKILQLTIAPDGKLVLAAELASGLQLDNQLQIPNSPLTGVPVGLAVDSHGRIHTGSNQRATIYSLTPSETP